MKKIKAFRLLGCMSLGAMLLAPVAQAQDATAGGTMTSDTTMMASGMSMTPTQVMGTVLRYYVDRAGYVTAMDVQTANGVQMVRFSPGMGQRLYSTAPVGGQVSVYAMGSPMRMGTTSMTRMDLVGIGDTMPAAGMMMPSMVSDIDLLDSQPLIMIGTKLTQFDGTLKDIVTSDSGEVLALVLSGVNASEAMGMKNMEKDGMAMTDPAAPAMSGEPMMGGSMMGGSMMSMTDVLVRVPREARQINTGGMTGGSMRVTPLFKGARVEVVGYPEAPRYGVVSRFGQRISATALVVNGRAVGAVGIPKMNAEMTKTLFKLNIGGGSTEEKNAGMMGYRTYDPNNTMSMGDGTMGGAGSMPGTDSSAAGTPAPAAGGAM